MSSYQEMKDRMYGKTTSSTSQKKSSGSNSGGGSGSSSYENMKNRLFAGTTISLGTDEERQSVSSWMNRYNKVMQGVSDYDKKRSGGFTRDASGGFGSEIESLIADYDGIKDYAGRNGLLNSQKYLNQLKNLQDSIGQINESFSQFDDEEEYGQYLEYLKDQDKKRSLDLDTYSREIATLEQQLEDYDPQIDWTDTNQRKQYDKGLQELEDEINRRKQYYTQAQRIQRQDADTKRFADIRSRSDFAENSSFDSNNREAGYRYVNADAAGRLDLEQQYGDHVRQFGDHAWDSLDEEEKQVYNYLMNTGDRKGAADYLRHLEESLQYRKGQAADTAMDALVAENPKAKALRYAFMANVGYDQHLSGMQGMGNMIAGKEDYVPPSSTQVAGQLVREDLGNDGKKLPDWLGGGSKGQMVGDLISTTANMVPSILASRVAGMVGGPVASKVATGLMMGGSAGGSAYQEMINEGYSKEQARLYGLSIGAAEGALESLLGGISSLGGGGIAKVTRWTENLDNALLNFALRLGGAGGSEALEEGLQEMISGWIKSEITHEDFWAKPADVLYSSLMGFLSGGMFEGPGIITDIGQQIAEGRNVLDSKGVAPLKEIAQTSTDQAVRKTAGKITDSSSAFAVGNLARKAQSEVAKQNAADLAKSLSQKGMPEKAARQYGDMLSYMLEAGSDTEIQRMVMESDPVVGQVLREAQMPGSKVQQRLQNLSAASGKTRSIERVASLYGKQAEAVKQVYNQGQKADGTKQDVETFAYGFQRAFTVGRENGNASAITEEIAPGLTPSQRELAYNLGRDAVAAEKAEATKRTTGEESSVHILNEDGSLGDAVRIAEITSNDRNNVTYVLEDGRTVSEDQLSFSGDNAVLDTVKELGLDVQTANIVIRGNKTITKADTLVAHGIDDAFRYGSHGYSLERLAKDSPFAALLTEEMRTAVYNAGKNAPDAAEKKPPAVKVKTRGKNAGIYYDAGGGDVKAYRPNQFGKLEHKRESGIYAAQVLQKLGVGVDFYFFKSYVNKKGERVYLDDNGMEQKAPNGWYDPSDGSIHIDLNAGNDGQGLTLFTMAHELTHFIEQWSPEKYKVLADFLIQNYEKGQSMDELVLIKQQALSAGRKKPVSYEEAYSEVIADSMEAMLADGNVMDKLRELKAKDSDLVARMKEFFDRMVKRITKYYQGLQPESEEGQLVLEMKDQFEQIQQLFAEALAEAGENFRAAAEIGLEVDAFVKEYKQEHPGRQFSDRRPSGQITKQDRVYLDAVNHGNLVAAQKIVDEAAKKAGYNSGIIYHGTPKFGFTWFDLDSMDDGISIFATSDKKIAESYSGETDRDTISDRELKNVDEMSDSELLKYVQRYIDPKYHLATDSQRSSLLKSHVEAFESIRQELIQIAEHNADGSAQGGLSQIYEIADILGEMAQTEDVSKLSALHEKFMYKMDSLFWHYPKVERLLHRVYKDAFASTTINFVSESVSQIYRNVTEIAKTDSLFVTNEENSAEYLPLNIAREQLKGRTENGIYGLYAKTDNVLELDANGVSWKMIDGKQIGRDGFVTTREVSQYAKDAGYNGVVIRNLIDSGGRTNYVEPSDIYILFDNTQVKSADPVTFDDTGNVIPLSERFNSGKNDIRYQDRSTGTSNRDLLAGAFEDLARSPAEMEFLQKYQENIGLLNEQEAKLQELRRQIREISFGKGSRDTKKLKELRDEATKTANRINTYDKILLNLEATVPLKRVLERERQKVKQKADADKKAAVAKVREETKAAIEGVQSEYEIMEREFLRLMRAYEKLSAQADAKAKNAQKKMDKKQDTIDSYKADLATMEREFLRVMKGYETAERKTNAFWEGEFKRLMREYEASGRKVDRLEAKLKAQRESIRSNVDSRRRTVLRNKIRKDIRELDKILNKGNKKRNVKQGMQDFVAKAIATGEILFADMDSDTDLIASGIQADMTADERKLLTEAERYVRQIAELEGNEAMADVLAARQKGLDEVLKQLQPVLERERIRINSADASSAFDALVAAYESLQESPDTYIAAAFNPDALEYLRSVKHKFAGTLVKDMSQEQLQELHKCYKMVMTMIRDANKAFVDGRSVQADAEQMVQEFQQRKIPAKKVGIILRNLSNTVGWNYEKLYYALERINSPTLKRLYQNLADSENITMQDVQEAKAFQMEMVEKYHYNDWKIDQKMERTFLDNNGKEFQLTLGELMALYAYSRREGADRHIEVGGFTFGKNALTDPAPASTYKLTADQVAAIGDLLTPEQKSFAEAMQRYLSKTMGAKGNEVSMKLYGIEMFGEENYFPLHIAGEYKARAQESQAKAEAGFQSMTNAGFTKARNTNATAPIVLESFMEVWVDHVNEMARYHGAVPALEDIRRVMNYSVYSDAMENSVSVKAAMTNAYGKQAVQYFDSLYREANSGAVTDKMDAVSKKLLSSFRKNSVAYSGSVVIQQPASIYRAMAIVAPKYFGHHGLFTLTRGVLRVVNRSKWNAAYADMMKYAPGVTMAKEIGGFDTSTGGSIRSYLLDTDRGFKQSMKNGTAAQKAGSVLNVVDDNVIANLPNVADKIAWIEIWEACRRETVANNPKLATGSEAFKQKVGQRFTEVIRATQVYDSMFSKSPMLKSKNLAVQYVVSFMNEPNTVANMAENALRDILNKDLKTAGKTVGALATSIVITNLLKSIVYAMRDEDEDETFREKYLSAVAGNLVSDVNLLNYIPYARDIWSIKEGYDVERADMAVVADAVNAITKLQKLNKEDVTRMTEEELEEWDKKVMDAQWKVAESLSPLAGIPLKNIRREVLAAINAVKIRELDKTRESTELSIRHAIEEATGQAERSDREKLYEAILAGDKVYTERLKAGYEDEDAYHAAIRKVLREKESRIWEAAIAWNRNDLAEYLRIGEEIVDEGHFEFDDIYSAIQTEANSMEESDSSPTKAKGKFTSEKFGVALGQNNTSMADIIRKDLIDTKVANGKTREEAASSVESTARSQLKELFGAGSITGAAAEKLLVRYGGYDQETSSGKVAEWQFEKDHPELDGRITYTQYKRWEADGKSRGVPLETYTEVAEYRGGDTSSGTRSQEDVAAYINSMPISTAQKDALWCCFWSEKTLYKNAPWH